MHNGRPHPLLEQVPLMVSPFVSLPTAPTLSYNYKPMPSSLPPSILAAGGAAPTAGSSSGVAGAAAHGRFVVSRNGVAAHPSEIVASCQDLLAHLRRMQDQADRELSRLEAALRAHETAEQRRVAPGWLDRDERLLQPQRAPGPVDALVFASARLQLAEPGDERLLLPQHISGQVDSLVRADARLQLARPGDELDRVFGAPPAVS